MGLFGNLFKKKVCDICHEDIGFLANNKLKDGNMCDDCEKKLSAYYYKEYKDTTISEIFEQLEYREENERKLKDFHPSRTVGRSGCDKILIDEDAGTFVVVEDDKKWREQNPDIIAIKDITNCSIDVEEEEEQEEIMRINKQGEEVSFNPPRYEYTYKYKVFLDIDVKGHKYIHQIDLEPWGKEITSRNQGQSVQLDSAKDLADEMKDALRTTKKEIKKKAAPKQAATCPWCGATTIPDASGCCEYCGGSVNG